MSVSGLAAALGALSSPTVGQLQQKIAAKVVMDQMESEAEMTRKLVQSGSELASSAHTGTRVDFRA